MPLIEQVLDKNPDTVKLVFMNMPLNFHKFADPSARAALAAHKQGKFWEFHDELFRTKPLNTNTINNVAAKIGLDIEQYNKDMQSKEIRSRLNKDMLEAQKAGVTGTPTIFINGKKLQNRSPQGFQAMINAELSNQ